MEQIHWAMVLMQKDIQLLPWAAIRMWKDLGPRRQQHISMYRENIILKAIPFMLLEVALLMPEQMLILFLTLEQAGLPVK
jgi:hypothetical protein